jgi:hypothetical protein
MWSGLTEQTGSVDLSRSATFPGMCAETTASERERNVQWREVGLGA